MDPIIHEDVSSLFVIALSVLAGLDELGKVIGHHDSQSQFWQVSDDLSAQDH